jgi:gamma-glutamyl:cysteine ligase YbdK (ATP-grasp superfamily)
MPRAAALGSREALEELAAGVRGNYSAADWLRERHAATGSLPDVVREASDLWARG